MDRRENKRGRQTDLEKDMKDMEGTKRTCSKRVGDARAKEITSHGPLRHSRVLASQSYWTASSAACGQSILIFVRKAAAYSCLGFRFEGGGR